MAHTVGPSIRWGPWDSQADHQLANTVVTIGPYKGPILSAFNIQAPIKYMLWADEGTRTEQNPRCRGVGAEIMPRS